MNALKYAMAYHRLHEATEEIGVHLTNLRVPWGIGKDGLPEARLDAREPVDLNVWTIIRTLNRIRQALQLLREATGTNRMTGKENQAASVVTVQSAEPQNQFAEKEWI